jgi:hypothetical protein
MPIINSLGWTAFVSASCGDAEEVMNELALFHHIAVAQPPDLSLSFTSMTISGHWRSEPKTRWLLPAAGMSSRSSLTQKEEPVPEKGLMTMNMQGNERNLCLSPD